MNPDGTPTGGSTYGMVDYYDDQNDWQIIIINILHTVLVISGELELMGTGGHNNNNMTNQYTNTYKEDKIQQHLSLVIKQINLEKLKQLSNRFKQIDTDTRQIT